MEIKFKITDVPKEEQKKYPTAYLEGILTIFVNEVLFFNQSGVLLIEFAIFINRWLNSIKKGDFADLNFETMDNDEPILSLTYVKDNLYGIYSVWQESEVSNLLDKENVVAVFEKYIEDLRNELKLERGIELDTIIKDSDL